MCNKEASLGLEVRAKAMTLCVYDVTSLIPQVEMRNFAEKNGKNIGKSTIDHSQQCNLLFHQQS